MREDAFETPSLIARDKRITIYATPASTPKLLRTQGGNFEVCANNIKDFYIFF